jgi:glycyl-tRNA synthetase beta chain
VDANKLCHDLSDLLRQRLVSLLEEQGVAVDLVQAVAGESVPLERLLRDPADAHGRAALLAELRAGGRLEAVRAVVTRASRLASKGDLACDVLEPRGVVNRELFETASEVAMLQVLEALAPVATSTTEERYSRLADGLAAAASTLAAFFDGDQSVMVMADDPAIRANRLNLLGLLNNQASVLADFSRVSG